MDKPDTKNNKSDGEEAASHNIMSGGASGGVVNDEGSPGGKVVDVLKAPEQGYHVTKLEEKSMEQKLEILEGMAGNQQGACSTEETNKLSRQTLAELQKMMDQGMSEWNVHPMWRHYLRSITLIENGYANAEAVAALHIGNEQKTESDTTEKSVNSFPDEGTPK